MSPNLSPSKTATNGVLAYTTFSPTWISVDATRPLPIPDPTAAGAVFVWTLGDIGRAVDMLGLVSAVCFCLAFAEKAQMKVPIADSHPCDMIGSLVRYLCNQFDWPFSPFGQAWSLCCDVVTFLFQIPMLPFLSSYKMYCIRCRRGQQA